LYTSLQSLTRLSYSLLFLLFLSVFPLFLFFFNDPPPTEIYTLSLHDALPIWPTRAVVARAAASTSDSKSRSRSSAIASCSRRSRSEEHTSELQSLTNLVCRLLLEKKKKQQT